MTTRFCGRLRALLGISSAALPNLKMVWQRRSGSANNRFRAHGLLELAARCGVLDGFLDVSSSLVPVDFAGRQCAQPTCPRVSSSVWSEEYRVGGRCFQGL